MSLNQRAINFDDFHQQFLNNHPSTIEEDFEGENLISEMTSQKTYPNHTDRKDKPSETKRVSPSVQILNSEPVRRFQLPSDSSMKTDRLAVTPELVDLGTVYIGQSVRGKFTVQGGDEHVTVSSSLIKVVFFDNDRQNTQLQGDTIEFCFRPDKLGPQEKYL